MKPRPSRVEPVFEGVLPLDAAGPLPPTFGVVREPLEHVLAERHTRLANVQQGVPSVPKGSAQRPKDLPRVSERVSDATRLVARFRGGPPILGPAQNGLG